MAARGGIIGGGEVSRTCGQPEPVSDARAAIVRVAGAADAEAIGAMLHDFNTEYHDFTPGAHALAGRVRELLADGELTVLLAGATPVGLAALRFRPGLWSEALECYLQELYVRPDLRGRGIGRGLLGAAIEHARSRGADRMDLGTSEEDAAAMALYESVGFTRREHGPDGPIMFFYELEL